MRSIFIILLVSICNFAYGKGWIDNGSYNQYTGWACVPNSDQIVGIHIYANNTYIGGGNAAKPREFAVQNACRSSTENHGFSISTDPPDFLLDGTEKDVRIYSIHADGSVSQLDNSPIKVKFPALRAPQRPIAYGDIVGRDLTYSWSTINYFGHIGIWDGAQVIEAVGTSNAADTLKLTSWESFSSAPGVWPTLSPELDEYSQVYCREVVCNVNSDITPPQWRLPLQTHVGGLRELAAKRAYLSYRIGASYTRLATFTPTAQGTNRYATEFCNPFATTCSPKLVTVKQSRGTYRCETFVMHSWAATIIDSEYSFLNMNLYGFGNLDKKSARWRKQIDYITSNFRLRSPRHVYENLKQWNI